MTISGLELLNDVGLHSTIETIGKGHKAIALNGLTLPKGKTRGYWTLVQYGKGRRNSSRVARFSKVGIGRET